MCSDYIPVASHIGVYFYDEAFKRSGLNYRVIVMLLLPYSTRRVLLMEGINHYYTHKRSFNFNLLPQ